MSVHSNHRMWRAASVFVVVGALLATAPLARAQSAAARKKKALKLYQKGTTQYDLGLWDQAITYYKKSYEQYPAPVLLLDIGQAYRQKGVCTKAVFFYKRYLSRVPNAPNRKEVQGFINDLEETCKRTEQAKDKQPTSTLPPNKTESSSQTGTGNANTGGRHVTTGTSGNSAATTTTTGATGNQTGEVGERSSGSNGDMAASGAAAGVTTAATPRRGVLVAMASVGPSFLMLGSKHQIPVQFAVRVGAGYPLSFGKLLLDVGGTATLSPVPFQGTTGANHTALLTGILANADVHYPILNKLDLRGELGLGALIWSGVDGKDSVFTDPNFQVSGPFTMFNVRVAAGVEYAVSPQLLLSAMPVVFSYSPAKEGMRSDIQRVAQYEMLVGVAYHL